MEKKASALMEIIEGRVTGGQEEVHQLHWQLCNQIAKFVANFGNSEKTSKPIRQKLCETLCNRPFRIFLTDLSHASTC